MLKQIIALLSVAAVFAKLPKDLAKHPQMGWNSWNHYHFDISEEVIKQTADAMVDSGLAALGYNYINVDDGWADFFRDQNGYIVVNSKFPSGMKALGDYIHSKNLKFGIYSDAGYFTCGFQAGSIYHETQDVQNYTQWGVDYLKYDNCYHPFMSAPDRYERMTKALEESERDFFFGICNWGYENTVSWAPKMAHSWRTTQDISDRWSSVLHNFKVNQQSQGSEGPLIGWNDPDMLEIGNGRLSLIQQKTHFTLWAMAKAPLLLGCDLTNLSSSIIDIIGNPEVIAVNQDALGVQAKCVKYCDNYDAAQVLLAPLSAESDDEIYAVEFINFSGSEVTIPSLRWEQDLLLPHDTWKVRDLWAKQDEDLSVGAYRSLTLKPYGSHLIKVQKRMTIQ